MPPPVSDPLVIRDKSKYNNAMIGFESRNLLLLIWISHKTLYLVTILFLTYFFDFLDIVLDEDTSSNFSSFLSVSSVSTFSSSISSIASVTDAAANPGVKYKNLNLLTVSPENENIVGVNE